MEKLSTLLLCSITFVLLARSDSCRFEAEFNYQIWEDLPIGSNVPYGLQDKIDAATMTLEGDLSTYFEIDPADVSILKTKVKIERDISGLEISGIMICKGSSGNVLATADRNFLIKLYNDISPTSYDDATFDWNENLVNIGDTSLDFEHAAIDDDYNDATEAVKITYSILNQIPSEIFSLRNTESASFYAKSGVDYETIKTVELTVTAKSTGVSSSTGDPYTEEATAIITVNINNLDDNSPTFSGCTEYSVDPSNPICPPPAYKGILPPGDGSASKKVNIDPPVLLEDKDSFPSTTTTYELYEGGSPTLSTDFAIDSSGEVTAMKDSYKLGEIYSLTLVATQDSSLMVYANMEIKIEFEDTAKPDVTISQTEGYVTSSSSPGQVVDVDGKVITITATDADGDTEFSYMITPSEFQVFNGILYYFPSAVSTRASTSDVTIQCINLNAELSSEFRLSDVKTIKITAATTATSAATTNIPTTNVVSTEVSTSDSIGTTIVTTPDLTSQAHTTELPIDITTTNNVIGTEAHTTELPIDITTTNNVIGTEGTGNIKTAQTDSTTLYIVAGVLSAVILILLVVILYLLCKEKDKNKKVDSISDGKRQMLNEHTNVSFEDEKSSNKSKSYYETAFEETSNKSAELKYDYPESEASGIKNLAQENEYVVDPHTINDAEQGESTELEDNHNLDAEKESLASSNKSDEDRLNNDENDYETELPPPPSPSSNHEQSSFKEELENRVKQAEETPSVNEDPPPILPPVLHIPPPPTVMFSDPPRTPLPDDDSASAVVNEIEGVINTFPLACQRNLCEHLRYIKEEQGASTELVSLKRFGLEKKDTFAIVKNYETSQMYENQIEANKRINELMVKIGTSNNQYILQYYGQYTNGGFIRQSIEFSPNGSLNEFFQKDPRAGNSRMRMNFISGITKGLSFIHSNNVVHGKLSSHCIWIDENLIAKIHGYENNEGFQLDKNDDRRKWFAPEVLGGELCTKASDIWSVGVVMWEIISGGETPYDGIDMNDIGSYLEGEKRLVKPETCSREMYTLVEGGCWCYQPKGRLDAKIVQSNIDEKLLQEPEALIGENMEPKINFSESHRVRFEDLDDITEF